VGDWLHSKEWSHWATLTTPYELTMKGARRLADRFHHRLSREGKTSMFWSAEPFDVKEGFHIHALLKAPEGIPYEVVVQCYQDVAGSKGWSRIQLDEFDRGWKKEGAQEYEPSKGATYYVGKYITKRLSDYDLLLPLKTKRPRRGSHKRA
ncbi:MAG: hypothetical protein ACKO96_06905, partial [Flammeovirgaceae bacterium]